MRKTLCATALVLALCGSTLAGDVNNPPIVGPSDIPSPSIALQTFGEQTADGVIHGDSAESVSAAALIVLNSVLPLL
ncbi:MAG: hypothetical protein QOH49_1232 [Acidobacteriota bacterium]|jgi:hypothetical protein|nr:hypothetical protein [Acidobacteriota bacterium]